jgi:hypothetical protein
VTDDAKPSRIRWHEETDPPGFTGYVGTVSDFLFRAYDPAGSETEHMLTAYMPGYTTRGSYGTPDEVKAEAETWLTEFTASLGAVFPAVGAHAFTRDGLVDALARLELRVPLIGPIAGKVSAGSMADAIIQALEEANDDR